MQNAIRTELTEKIVRQCGDNLWGSCIQYSVAEWRREVDNGDTVAGYWEWVVSQAESDGTSLDVLTGDASSLRQTADDARP